MIKRIYDSTLHIKDPVPHFLFHSWCRAHKGHVCAVHDAAKEASRLLKPFLSKVIADLSDQMKESIQVESQSYRDPLYCFFFAAHTRNARSEQYNWVETLFPYTDFISSALSCLLPYWATLKSIGSDLTSVRCCVGDPNTQSRIWWVSHRLSTSASCLLRGAAGWQLSVCVHSDSSQDHRNLSSHLCCSVFTHITVFPVTDYNVNSLSGIKMFIYSAM